MTLYQYDALGNLLCVEQHGGVSGTGCSAPPSSDPTSPWRVRRFTYDSLSRLLTAANPESGIITSPGSGVITYFYDANGNLLQKVMPTPNQTGTAQHTVSYCYDPLNRVNGKAYSWQNCQNGKLPQGTAVVTYTYDEGTDGIGHLTTVTDQAGSAIYSFDTLGRLSSEKRTTANVTKTMDYTYNLDGSVATATYPSRTMITYTPDSAGRMLSAEDTTNSIKYVAGAKYNATGALTDSVYGYSSSFTGIVNSFSFNNRLQPATLWSSSPARTLMYLVYDFHQGNGDNGNVWGITNNRDTTRSQSFTYDALNRLASAQNAGTDCKVTLLDGTSPKFWGNSYSYDAWGNLQKTPIPTHCGGENLSVTASVKNQLQSGYQYDAAGNMTHDGTANLDYVYDPENRIMGAGGLTYTYDADGNRVEKSNGSTTPPTGTLYWYMSLGIVGESDLTGNLTTEYIFFDGARVARKDYPGNAVSYYFSDHLKTASVVTDATGTIQDESDYYPWGGELQFVNNMDNHYKFTGKERDAETGLDYFGARYYGNLLGRWVSPDPLMSSAHGANPQSWNRYTYVYNNPLRHIDPDGQQALDLSNPNVQKLLKTLRAPAGKALGTVKGGLIQTVADYTIKTLVGELFGYSPMAARGDLTANEYKLLKKVSSFEKGATMLGVGRNNQPGIDAVDLTNQKGVSLKEAANIERAKDQAVRAFNSAEKAGFYGVDVYIDAPSVSKSEATGQTKIQNLLGTGTITKVVIFTGEGSVVYQPTADQQKHINCHQSGKSPCP